MTFKNNKARIATTIISSLVIGLLIFSPTTIIPGVNAQIPSVNKKILDPSTPQGATCLEEIQKDTRSKYASFDEKQAMTSAVAYGKFKTEVQNDHYANGHVVIIWSIDPVNCVVTPTGLSVQFMVTNATGKQRVVIVDEDIESLLPTGVTSEEAGPYHTVPSTTDPHLSGYQFYAPPGTSNPAILQGTLTYTVPVPYLPSKPSGFTCGTSNSTACWASVWSGIAVNSGGAGKLVQTGTDSVCLGNNGAGDCATKKYYSWLEIYDGLGSSQNGISYCNNAQQHNPVLNVHGGDSVLSQVTNEAQYGGPNWNYDVYLVDITQNIQCTSTFTYNVGNPNYGLYMLERPLFSTYAKLAQFNPISSMYGTIWYNSANHGIQVPFDAGSGTKYLMSNGGVSNTDVTDVSSSRFTISWLTSQNTG